MINIINEQLSWPSKMFNGVHMGSRLMCMNDKINMIDPKKLVLNNDLKCQYSHVNVINNYRRIQSDDDSLLPMLSSGNTSTKVPCNSVNTGDGFRYTNNTNPYSYGLVLREPNCVYGHTVQNYCTSG